MQDDSSIPIPRHASNAALPTSPTAPTRIVFIPIKQRNNSKHFIPLHILTSKHCIKDLLLFPKSLWQDSTSPNAKKDKRYLFILITLANVHRKECNGYVANRNRPHYIAFFLCSVNCSFSHIFQVVCHDCVEVVPEGFCRHEVILSKFYLQNKNLPLGFLEYSLTIFAHPKGLRDRLQTHKLKHYL